MEAIEASAAGAWREGRAAWEETGATMACEEVEASVTTVGGAAAAAEWRAAAAAGEIAGKVAAAAAAWAVSAWGVRDPEAGGGARGEVQPVALRAGGMVASEVARPVVF